MIKGQSEHRSVAGIKWKQGEVSPDRMTLKEWNETQCQTFTVKKSICFSYSESSIASISHLELEHHWYPCWEEHIETQFTEAYQEKKDILNCAKEVS